MEPAGDDLTDQEVERVRTALVVGADDHVGLRLVEGRKIAHPWQAATAAAPPETSGRQKLDPGITLSRWGRRAATPTPP